MSAITKLVLNHPESSKNQLLIHISKPKGDLGQILIIAEIEKAQIESLGIIKKLTAEMQNIYFSENTKSLEKALENSLQKINIIISDMVKQHTDIWLNNLNMVIIAYNDSEIHFSKIGKIRTFLAAQKAITDIISENKEEKVNIIKAFANIFSGKINKGEGIIFLNENVLDYISQEKIKRLIIDSKTPNLALKKLEDLLKKAPKNKTFSAILIKESLEQIQDNQKEGGNGNIKSLQDTSFPKTASLKSKEQEENKIDEKEKNKMFNVLLKSKFKEKEKENNSSTGFYKKNKNYSFYDHIREMPILSKLSLVFFIIIIVLLINIFSRSKTYEPPSTINLNNTFESSLAKLKAVQIEANTAFIMEDLNVAKVSLNKAREFLTLLPENTEERKIIKQEISKEVNKSWLKALGIKELENPKILVDLNQENKEIKISEMVKKDDDLYFYAQEPFLLLKYNLKLNKTEKINATSLAAPKITKLIDSLNKTLIFYSAESKNLASLNLEDNKISALSWDKSKAVKNPDNFAIYQDKLYVLDQSANQIFRYQKNISGFGIESKWLEPTIDLTGTISLAIDGNIWVLNKEGKILKFFKGKPESFSYNLEPEFKTPSKIYTNIDSLYLYVLDSGSKRVVILNKSGAIISQFTSDSFDNLRDLLVAEKERKLYLLNGEKVYEVEF